MKKIAVALVAIMLIFSFASCAEQQQDLTSINDYVAPSYTYKIATGTLTFADTVGENATITDYVGLYTKHTVEVPEKVGSDKDGWRIITAIGKEAFYYCTAATSITIPDTVTSIGDWAFAGCTSLETIVIPASVTSIGKGAFNGCTALKSVIFEGTEIVSIGDYAFNDCTSLETIALPEGLTSIGIQAFCDCTSLKSATTPSTLKSIGDMAFYNCTGLNTDGALKLSASIEKIGEFAFTGIDKNLISAPADSYAAKYVAEMRDLTENETETK
jgi:hypothetical protein